MQYDIVRHGNEQEPVIIVDDFSTHYDALFNDAKYANFQTAAAGYPGIRAPLSARYLAERGALLSDIVREVFSFKSGIKCESCDYSMVTILPIDLQPAQRIPHYDAPNSDILAFMHYGKGRGGTAFYRHIATGFETVTAERQSSYSAALEDEVKRLGMPDPAYIYGNSDRFEMIGEIEPRPNRFILYRGRTLHSGCISKDAIFSDDPAVGRLTINGFLSDN